MSASTWDLGEAGRLEWPVLAKGRDTPGEGVRRVAWAGASILVSTILQGRVKAELQPGGYGPGEGGCQYARLRESLCPGDKPLHMGEGCPALQARPCRGWSAYKTAARQQPSLPRRMFAVCLVCSGGPRGMDSLWIRPVGAPGQPPGCLAGPEQPVAPRSLLPAQHPGQLLGWALRHCGSRGLLPLCGPSGCPLLASGGDVPGEVCVQAAHGAKGSRGPRLAPHWRVGGILGVFSAVSSS